MKKTKTTMRWAVSFFALLMPFILASSLYAQNNAGDNIVLNGSFEDADVGDTNADNWRFVDNEDRGATADYVIVDDPVQHGERALQVTVNTVGDNNRFIQAEHQGAPLEVGETYTVSLFAKASDDGAMINIVASSDLGGAFYRHNDQSVGTEWQEYTFEFVVDEQPEYGRFFVHFNFDENVGKTLWIDNLSVVKVEEELPEPGENIIANGSFEDSELGTDGSDVNWGVETRGDAEANFEIVNDPVQDGEKAMQITVNELGDNPWFIQIFHEGAPLVSGEVYRLTVFAKASDDAMINIIASSDLGGAYHRANQLSIGTDWKEITFDFEVDNDPLYGLFMVHANLDGNEGKNIWIDNLSVVLLEEEEPQPVENIVLNGSFEDAEVGDTSADNWWHQVNEDAGADADFLIVDDPVQDGERAMQVTIDAVGENPWFIQLVNQNSEIEPGETYHFSMYAKASEDGAKMNFTAGNTSFQQYGNLNNQTLSTEWQRFEFEFTVDDDETVGRHAMHFSFEENIGKTIWVDNLVIKVAVEEDDDHDFEPADPIAFDPENIVNPNGGFESSSVGAESASGWWFGTGGGDRALADIVDDPTYEGERALRVTVTDLGDNPWDVQFVNTNIPVEPGQTYMYSVYMKASREGTVANMTVENNSFEAYNTMNAVPLSTEWREYRNYFTITDGESEMRSAIHLNFDENFQATFYIDNLRIIPHNPPALTNGGFELSEAGSDHNDIMNWTFNGQQNDFADFRIVNDSLMNEEEEADAAKEGNHALEAVVHDIGEERWSVEVKYMGAVLEKDQPYKATFWARASEDGAVIRTNPMFMPGWEWPGSFDAELTTEWQKFSYYFLRESDFDDVEIPMQLGFEENIGKTIYIDNYTIVPVMEIPEEEEEPTSAEELAETVREFQLDQNYPNPFNPATTIRYAVPEASHVSLRVYDITGRLVATLVDANREAGYHHVTLDGTQLASGIYIYRMQAGDFSQTRKLTLIK